MCIKDKPHTHTCMHTLYTFTTGYKRLRVTYGSLMDTICTKSLCLKLRLSTELSTLKKDKVLPLRSNLLTLRETVLLAFEVECCTEHAHDDNSKDDT